MGWLGGSTIGRKLTSISVLSSVTALLSASVAFLANDAYTFRQFLTRRIATEAEIIAFNSVSPILFICDSEKDRLPQILKSLESAPVLTVGEMSDFAERGGVIRFKVEQDRIRLEINVAAAERSRLRISSQLLKLARIVEPGTGG